MYKIPFRFLILYLLFEFFFPFILIKVISNNTVYYIYCMYDCANAEKNCEEFLFYLCEGFLYRGKN